MHALARQRQKHKRQRQRQLQLQHQQLPPGQLELLLKRKKRKRGPEGHLTEARSWFPPSHRRPHWRTPILSFGHSAAIMTCTRRTPASAGHSPGQQQHELVPVQARPGHHRCPRCPRCHHHRPRTRTRSTSTTDCFCCRRPPERSWGRTTGTRTRAVAMACSRAAPTLTSPSGPLDTELALHLAPRASAWDWARPPSTPSSPTPRPP